MDTVALVLDWPPSINHYYVRSRYGGGVVLSETGRAYKDLIGWTLRAEGLEPLSVPLALTCWLFRPNKRGDIDNYFKALLDALKGHLYDDDSQIEQLTTYRLLDKSKPRVELLACPSFSIPPSSPSTLYPNLKDGNSLYRLE